MAGRNSQGEMREETVGNRLSGLHETGIRLLRMRISIIFSVLYFELEKKSSYKITINRCRYKKISESKRNNGKKKTLSWNPRKKDFSSESLCPILFFIIPCPQWLADSCSRTVPSTRACTRTAFSGALRHCVSVNMHDSHYLFICLFIRLFVPEML